MSASVVGHPLRYRPLLASALCLAFAAFGCSSSDEPEGPCQCDLADSGQEPCPGTDSGPGEPDTSLLEAQSPESASPESSPPEASPEDSSVDAPAPSRQLRIMTFNIKHGELSSLGAIADVINSEAPDLVGLQEVDVDAPRSDNVDQPHRLGQLTGMANLFRTALNLSGGGQYGVALLSRYPIVTSERLLLTSATEQRILATVEVRLPQGQTPIAITHLGLNASERVTQVQEILGALSGKPNAVLMGDFNGTTSDPAIATLTGEMTDSWQLAGQGPGNTIPSDTPNKRIDFILLGSGWAAPLEAHVPSTEASDHRPVVVTVPLPE